MVEAKYQRRIGLLILLAAGHPAILIAGDGASPFVAGFDRFARFGEIDSVTAGRLLITELSCTACHVSDDIVLQPKRGPRLDGVGSRLHSDWIMQFLANPEQAKRGTTMPAILNDLSVDDKAITIRALVAFLGSLQESFPEIKGTGARPVPNEFWNAGDFRQGRQLFHRIGCVACHAPDETYETVATKPTPLDDLLAQLDPEELKEAGLLSVARRVESVPLGDLVMKYTRQSLTFFLLDPHRVRPAGRMPDFHLGVVEAADIAAWLLLDQPPGSTSQMKNEIGDASLVNQGRQLFAELGCANCHAAAETKSLWPATSFSHLDLNSDRQCIDSGSRGLPQFSLDGQQFAAIQSALQHPKAEQDTSPALAQVQLTMLNLNCLACHERGQHGGVGRYRKAYFETQGNVDIGDEGRLPPPLTGVGGKLTLKSIEQVLQGKAIVRTHMRIRMPIFAGEQINALPRLLASIDGGNEQASEQEVFRDRADLADAGRQLLDTGCVQCHSLRGETLPGVIGIDLEGIAERVRPQWFHDFVLNPAQLKPHTRMPSFFPGGKSQNQSVLNGDTEKQIAAMWTYLKGIGNHRLPKKLELARSQNYELKPIDRPLVLRTFMDLAGTHAIAVGFPQQVHFAFDAEQIRLAQAWRGRFLDAQGTWFVRFAPPARPLGEDAINLPAGVPFAFLKNPAAAWPTADVEISSATATEYRFLGYRLDPAGVPGFLYRVGDVDVEDRITPNDQRQLVRQMILRKPTNGKSSQQLWLRAHQGKSLELAGEASCRSESGLTVMLDDQLANTGAIRNGEDGMEWTIPLSFDRRQTIEVRYQW